LVQYRKKESKAQVAFVSTVSIKRYFAFQVKMYRKKKSSSRTSRTRPYGSRSKTSKASYAKATVAIATPSVGLGTGARTQLVTSFFANVTPVAGTGVFTGYLKPGSCFDPTGDIAAIQPAAYDQWAALYGRYLVEKCKVVIEYSRQTVTAAQQFAFVAAAYPSISATALATYQGAASQPFAKTLLCGVNDNTTSNTMIFNLDHKKVLGQKEGLSSIDNGGVVGADPPANQFMQLPIFIQNANVGADPVTLKITMIQTVFFDRRIQVVDA